MTARTRRRGRGAGPQVVETTTRESAILAQMDRGVVHTEEDLRGLVGEEGMATPGDRGTVTHERPNRIAMFKKTPMGWMLYPVPTTSVPVNLKNGMRLDCPDCGVEAEAHNPGVNGCPKRPVRAFRVCPVPTCRKHVYDVWQGEEAPEGEAEAGLIHDDAYLEATPEMRTKVRLDQHMLGYHPSEAAMMGVQRPEPLPPSGRQGDTTLAAVGAQVREQGEGEADV